MSVAYREIIKRHGSYHVIYTNKLNNLTILWRFIKYMATTLRGTFHKVN